MQTKDFSVTLDMIRTLPFRPFDVVEGDTGNILHVTLLNNGDAMDLSNCAIQIAYASSSGFAMQDETSGIVKTAAMGTFDVTLLPSAYGAGNVSADVQIYSGEHSETLVTSTRFDFRCRKSLISGDIIRANLAYPPLVEAARVANEAAEFARLQAARIGNDIGEMNVQSDWAEADTEQDSYIRNKPTLPSSPGEVGAAPALHASQHEQGGSDPITPLFHGSTHAQGGADEITPDDIGAARLIDGSIDVLQCGVAIHHENGSYTAVVADNGKDIWIESDSDETLIVPDDLTAAFPDQAYFFVTRAGAGALTLVPASGVTLHSAGGRLNLSEQYCTVLLRKQSANTWLVTGSLSV